MFYLSLPSRTISTISCDVILALIDGASKGEEPFTSGIKAKVCPSFLRIRTFQYFQLVRERWRVSAELLNMYKLAF